MKQGFLMLMILLSVVKLVDAQIVLQGIVTDARNAVPLAGATIQIAGSDEVTVSGLNGNFQLKTPEAGAFSVIVSFVGYKTQVFEVKPGAQQVNIEMQAEIQMLAETVVTATRSRRGVLDVPLRVDLVSKERLDNIEALSVDDYLRLVPGINVSRGASIFGAGHVSLRGMGDEAGRTLVMIDGVPVNKSDGGTVTWNAINADDVEQIEILKGPGSSIHGGNAMGGVINLITTRPTRKLEGYISQSYGTFNTVQTKGGLSGKTDDFYWGAHGMFRQSEGYITAPADEINEYSVASFLDEYQFGGRLGYFLNANHMIELSGAYYLGQRGTGTDFSGHGFTNDEFAAPDGAYNQFGSLKGRLLYRAAFNNHSQLQLTLFGQRENFQNIRENLRDSVISRFDVESIRNDIGLLSSFQTRIGKHHTIVTGLDIRNGGVDGADIYLTSTDSVLNLGKMNQLGIYVQDEISLGDSPWSVLAGLRYDYVNFYDGYFIVKAPTSQTRFLQDFADTLDDASFSALSPRLSMQYHKEGSFRVYGGYSRGFRAPVLDDMCRTGRIAGGMKIANPHLKPEYLDNFEIGGDVILFDRLSITPSVFYAIGTDYHAYISTGDSLLMHNRMRPIRKKDNIGKVNITGAELAANVMIVEGLNLSAAYAYTHTEITAFDVFDPVMDENLKGKALVYQPKDIFNASVSWKNKYINAWVSYNYKSAQWINDVNTEKVESFNYIDIRLWRQVYRGLSVSVAAHNLLDQDFIDSRNMIAPGRMLNAELIYKF